MRQGAQVNPRIVLPKSNWDSPACGQRNPVCAYLAWKTVLSFATSSSTSLPCTIAASSSVSAVECGQNRQCIPISVKIFTTASIAASEQENMTVHMQSVTSAPVARNKKVQLEAYDGENPFNDSDLPVDME